MIEITQQSMFDYTSLDADTCTFLQEQEEELDCVLKRTSKEIGDILLKVKHRLPHGQYILWLVSRGISRTTAWRCMQVAQGKETDKCSIMEHLPPVESDEIPSTAPIIRGTEQPVQPEQTQFLTPNEFLDEVFPGFRERQQEQVAEVVPVEEEKPRYQVPIMVSYDEYLPPEVVKEKRDAHVMDVMGSSDSPEWYTPQHIINRVCDLFGEIATDPCSNSHETPTVPACNLYTKEDDGLAHAWTGKTYLNPPYGAEISKWTDKLVAEYNSGNVTEALALLPARIDTVWFSPLYEYLMCNVRGRVQYANSPHHAPFPCVIVYLGKREGEFIEAFRGLGPIMRRIA